MKQIFIKPARPRRNIQCVAFAATAALVATMLAQGIRVRTNILSPWEYVAPFDDISISRWDELLRDSRFKFIASVTFLTSPTGSNQSFSVPGNWNNGNNSIQCIGAGGSGAVINSGFGCCATGGGGGAYSAQTNVTLTPLGTATWQVGPGGNSVSFAGANGAVNGNAGGDTWFNGASLGASSCGAKGGGGGTQFAGSSAAGALGGAAGSGIGSTKVSGGQSGNAFIVSSDTGASGGGGSGGPNGAGGNAPNATDNNGAGGSADGGTVPGGVADGNGNSGTEFDGSHGCGSGGGSDIGNLSSVTAGTGAFYGGGSGSVACFSGGGPFTSVSGNAGPGIIVVSFTPGSRCSMVAMIG